MKGGIVTGAASAQSAQLGPNGNSDGLTVMVRPDRKALLLNIEVLSGFLMMFGPDTFVAVFADDAGNSRMAVSAPASLIDATHFIDLAVPLAPPEETHVAVFQLAPATPRWRIDLEENVRRWVKARVKWIDRIRVMDLVAYNGRRFVSAAAAHDQGL